MVVYWWLDTESRWRDLACRQDIAEDDAALWTISRLQEHDKLLEDGKINVKDPRANKELCASLLLVHWKQYSI